MREELKIIYRLFSDRKYHTAKDLSKVLASSSKTFSKKIKELNEILAKHNIVIESKTSKGYILKGDILSEYEIFKYEEEHQLDTIEKRVNYLLFKLSDNSKYIKVEELLSEMFVSRKTMSLDLKKVSEILNKYSLKLVKKPHYGIRLEGLEENIRNLLVELLENKINEKRYLNLIKENILENIANELYEYFDDNNIKMSDIRFQNLFLSIIVSIGRSKKHPINSVQIEKTKLFLETRDIVLKIKDEVLNKYVFSELDIDYITIRFLSSQSLSYASINNDITEIKEIINEILYYMNLTFQINLFDNSVLYKNLYTHLVSLVIRLRFNIHLTNPLLDEIKKNMHFEYSVSQYLAKIIKSKYGKMVSDEEVAYLAMIMYIGIQADKTKNAKKNILLVCPSGGGVSKFLVYTYENLFSEYLNDIKACGLKELSKKDLSDVDIIFTLVDLDMKIEKPVYKINTFLTNADITKIKNILGMEKYNFEEILRSDLFVYLEDENVTKEEAIKIMAEKLKKVENMSQNIEQKILERESLGMTEISNRVSIPHSIDVIKNVNVIGILISKHPIKWQENEVNLALFMCLDNEKYNNDIVYKAILDIVGNEKIIENILMNPDYKNFLSIIKEKTYAL